MWCPCDVSICLTVTVDNPYNQAMHWPKPTWSTNKQSSNNQQYKPTIDDWLRVFDVHPGYSARHFTTDVSGCFRFSGSLLFCRTNYWNNNFAKSQLVCCLQQRDLSFRNFSIQFEIPIVHADLCFTQSPLTSTQLTPLTQVTLLPSLSSTQRRKTKSTEAWSVKPLRLSRRSQLSC